MLGPCLEFLGSAGRAVKRVPILPAVLVLWLVGFAGHAQDAAQVDVTTPQPVEGRQTLTLTGSANAERRADLSSRVSGLVQSVPVDAGYRAEAGEVLVELDTALAEVALARADAAVAEAKTRLSEAIRLRKEAENLGENIPSTERRTRVAAVAQARANLARLQADRRERAELLERHKVVAPFDGVVSAKLTEVGEWVQTGTPVLEFVGSGAVRFDVHAPQDYYPLITQSTPAEIRFDALPERAYTGTLIAKVPDSASEGRTFLVRFRVADAGQDVIPGMSGVARLTLSSARTAYLLPRDAVTRYPDGTTTVWIVERTGDGIRAVEREVVLSGGLADTVEVVEGVTPEMRVIIRGNEVLRDGQPVTVRNVVAPPAADSATPGSEG